MADKIMLIDGNNIINRAYYAVPLLTNKDGQYTNGVYGFLNIFFKLIDEENPNYVAVAFDLPKPTFRHLKYKEYKGTRKKSADELVSQFPILKEILTKMKIKIYELEGYEADDILGTLSVKALENDIIPVIISGDEDLLQLVTDKVKVRVPKTKAGKTEIEDYYENDIIAKYGLSPIEYIDYKALKGDSSDNIPGVPSIGEKTATKIIQKYKNIDNALKDAENITPPKASQNIIKYKEQLLLSKELVTIVKDVPIEFKLEDNKADDIFNDEAYESFKQYEFKSLLGKFDKKVKNKNIENVNYKFIDTRREAEQYFYNLNPWEETAYKIIFDDNDILGISISSQEDRGTFISIGNGIDERILFSITKDFFEGDGKKIAHDAKKDIVLLNKYNINLNSLEFDTMIAGYILNPTKNTYEYNDIASDFLKENYPLEEEILGKGKNKLGLNEIDKKELILFACRQSDVSFRAKDIMDKKINENNQNKLYYDIELPLLYVLADMEITGIKIDKDILEDYREELAIKIDELTKDIYTIAGEGFNINSPKQLGAILFEKLGLEGSKKIKTGWSTSADVLERLKGKHKIIDKIIEYRTYAKLKTTYADGLLNVMNNETNKIHSTFNQAITATGRISSTEPNLQNIPIKIELGHRLRKVFIPTDENYVFIDGDYSQIELRVLAHMSNDETLIKAFKEGNDIHRLTASQVLNVPFDKVTYTQRNNAKAVNFGIVYGISSFRLSNEIGMSKKEAEQYINGYFEKYPKVKKYMDDTIEKAKKDGYASTIFNRIRYIPELSSSNFMMRSFGERVAMNMPVQGSAADIIKIAMVKVYKRLKEKGLMSRIILQVHDELLIEAHKSEIDIVGKILKNEMEKAVELLVPIDVDIHEGDNWYEAK